MRGFMHHTDLTVVNPAASASFYEAVLGAFGYQRVRDFEWQLTSSAGSSSIGLVQAHGSGRPHDRYTPGLHHMAFRAESRQDVDDIHTALKAYGATILDAPADYPQYNGGRGYYAVFFSDPDGLKLEFVYTPD